MSTVNRAKRVIAYHGLIITLVLALLGFAALAGAWTTYTTPSTERITEQTNEQTITTDMRTSAIVVGNTTLYDQGAVLKDQPVYLRSATPNLTLTVATTVPADHAVRVSQRLVLDVRAERNGETFWQKRRLLGRQTTRVSDGQAVMSTTINIAAIENETTEQRSEIGPVGTFHTDLLLNVSYETNRYTDRLTATAPLQITERAYWIDGSLRAERTHTTTVTRQVTTAPAPVQYVGLGLLGVGALVAAAAIGAMRYRGIDITAIDTQLYRSRYDEWISEGEFPTGTNKRYVRVSSLEDLVDIAIDSNKRVLYDPEFDAYAVADSDLVYYFTEARTRIDSWLDI